MEKIEQLLKLLQTIIFKGNPIEFFKSMTDEEKLIIYSKTNDYNLSHFIYFYLHKVIEDKWKNLFSIEYRNASALELKRSIELKRIYELFNQNNINCAPLKGSFLAYFAYPNPVLRRMSDIDILIPDEQVNNAWELLNQNGYKSVHIRLESHHKPALISPNGFYIELHYHIKPFKDNDIKYFDSILLWKNSKKIKFYDTEIYLLSPEVILLHILDHYFHDHLASGLRAYLDVGFIISTLKPDSQFLYQLAEKMKLIKELVLFTNIFKDFLPNDYVYTPHENIQEYINQAFFIISNHNLILSKPNFKIGYFREFKGKKFKEKLLFILKEFFISPKFIETKFKIKTNIISLLFYYLLYYFSSSLKFIKCLFLSNKDKIMIDVGEKQRQLQYFLNK